MLDFMPINKAVSICNSTIAEPNWNIFLIGWNDIMHIRTRNIDMHRPFSHSRAQIHITASIDSLNLCNRHSHKFMINFGCSDLAVRIFRWWRYYYLAYNKNFDFFFWKLLCNVVVSADFFFVRRHRVVDFFHLLKESFKFRKEFTIKRENLIFKIQLQIEFDRTKEWLLLLSRTISSYCHQFLWNLNSLVLISFENHQCFHQISKNLSFSMNQWKIMRINCLHGVYLRKHEYMRCDGR